MTAPLAHLMALGIGKGATAVPITVGRGERMNRDGFPGAVHAIGTSAARREHAERVAASMTSRQTRAAKAKRGIALGRPHANLKTIPYRSGSTAERRECEHVGDELPNSGPRFFQDRYSTYRLHPLL